jgi:hypothetical protein
MDLVIQGAEQSWHQDTRATESRTSAI